MTKLAIATFISFILFIGIHSAQSLPADPDEKITHYTCDLEVALSTDKKANVKTKNKIDHSTHLIGRGVANCRNQQGFEFNLPAVMSVALSSDEQIPIEALRATLQPVSVSRDVNRIFDHYTPHFVLETTPSVMPNASAERAVIVKGKKNDVLLQLNLNVPSEFTSKVRVTKIDLRFDNDAPELESQ